MIIEHIATGRRVEVADGTKYPVTAYREVKDEPITVADTAPQFEPTPEPTPEKKPSKKKTTKKKPSKKKTTKKAKKA